MNNNLQKVPPGLRIRFDAPAWEQAKAWIERPIEFWKECHAAFGDMFTLDLGSQGMTVLFCHPNAVRSVFALPADHYQCGPFNQHYQEIMGELSLLVLDGSAHREQRRLVAPQLLLDRNETVKVNAEKILAPRLNALPAGQVLDLRPIIHEIAFEMMLDMLLADGQAEFRRLLANIFLKDLTKDYGTWSPWARFTKWHPLLRKSIAAETERLRRNPKHEPTKPSLFETIVHYQAVDGKYLPEQQIADHIFTMLIAGVDPSAIATLWAAYWIHQDSTIRDRLREAVIRMGSEPIGSPNPNDRRSDSAEELPTQVKNGLSEQSARNTERKKMTLLESACLESLRMIPVVATPSGRKLLKEVEIDGRVYPPGVTLLPCTYLVHRRPDLYPDPEKFIPERFQTRTYKPYEYFPFGGGHRVCPGARMAMATMQAISGTLLRLVKLEIAADGPVTPVRHGTLLAPSPNLKFRIVERY